jgi:hypothetical protein
VFAAVFGLVHGAGFAGYLKSLFVERIAVPLLGFNVGIEIGQVVVLLGAAVAYLAIDQVLALATSRWRRVEPFRWRLVGVSAVVALVATGWAWDRFPR